MNRVCRDDVELLGRRQDVVASIVVDDRDPRISYDIVVVATEVTIGRPGKNVEAKADRRILRGVPVKPRPDETSGVLEVLYPENLRRVPPPVRVALRHDAMLDRRSMHRKKA